MVWFEYLINCWSLVLVDSTEQWKCLYNLGEGKSISEYTACQTLRQKGCNSRRPQDRFHSFQSSTSTWVYSGYRLTETGQVKIGKMLPDLMNFCFGIWCQLFKSLLSAVQAGGCDIIVRGTIFDRYWAMNYTNQSALKSHSQSEYCCWPCASHNGLNLPSFNGYFIRTMHHVTKHKQHIY